MFRLQWTSRDHVGLIDPEELGQELAKLRCKSGVQIQIDEPIAWHALQLLEPSGGCLSTPAGTSLEPSQKSVRPRCGPQGQGTRLEGNHVHRSSL